jgi:hypothetical protein
MFSDDTSSPNVMFLLQSIAKRANTILHITKPFKGTLLSQETRILAITSNSIVLQAADVRMGITSGDCVYLISELLPKPVKARLCDISCTHNTFTLRELTYKEECWKERCQERVTPEQPTYARLTWNKKDIRTSVENISSRGVGLLAYKLAEKGFNIDPKANILLDFQLTPICRLTGLRGTVIYLHPLGMAFTRIGVEIHPNLSQNKQLKLYIASQKDAILSELNQIYFKALHEPDVVDQFF